MAGVGAVGKALILTKPFSPLAICEVPGREKGDESLAQKSVPVSMLQPPPEYPLLPGQVPGYGASVPSTLGCST